MTLKIAVSRGTPGFRGLKDPEQDLAWLAPCPIGTGSRSRSSLCRLSCCAQLRSRRSGSP